MKYDHARATELLSLGTNHGVTTFRQGQSEAIQHIVEGRGRLLVVQKTGWGKSFVYFIAAKLMREQGAGPILLISPLLSLMRNQVAAAKSMGVRAETINSDNLEDWTAIAEEVKQDAIDVLIISPERLSSKTFKETILPIISPKVSLLVVDEAHCISDWGHDFRPQYRLLERIVRTLPANLRILATTATANNRVMQDLIEILGPNITTLKGDLNRPSLTLQTIQLPSQAERMAWLSEQLIKIPGSGIIYTLTVRDAQMVTSWLKHCGHNVECYTGKSVGRAELEDALIQNKIKALVATTALGMGYDKPDLAFVFHFQMPASVVAYYQQVGRAGRALPNAYGVLLSGDGDDAISTWFIESAFPSKDNVEKILAALGSSADGLSVPEILKVVNLNQSSVNKVLDLLEIESPAPVVKVGPKWRLTIANLNESFWLRAERLTILRHNELAEMKQYISLPFGSHMNFLIQALDGVPTYPPAIQLPPLSENIAPELIQAAIDFLKRSDLPISPRKKWPSGGLPSYNLKGNIDAAHLAQPGKSLSMWGDAGWGTAVKTGRYDLKDFNDELVEACAQMILKWAPEPAPQWVTAIPSLRHPNMVPSFAHRLALRLGLPYLQALQKVAHTAEQKYMANSTKQALNLDKSLAIDLLKIHPGPVLLVDDIVNSGWTFTVAAWLLQNHGSGIVWPVALAQSGSGSE